ncbi:MAG: hypothetical protein ABR923_14210 [Terracidiphilus sp.]|jgi:DNA-binding NtrC family response regulator
MLFLDPAALIRRNSGIRIRNSIFAARTVRELEQAIDRALAMRVADRTLPEDLPAEILKMVSTEPGSSDKYDQCQSGVKEPKKQLVLKAMQQFSGNCIEAAKMLGLRSALHPRVTLGRTRRAASAQWRESF